MAPGVADFLCQEALAVSDMIAPNLLELETLSGQTIHNVDEAVAAARELCKKGRVWYWSNTCPALVTVLTASK